VTQKNGSNISISNITEIEWWNTNWQYRKLIIIKHEITQEEQQNIPLLLDIIDTDLPLKAKTDGSDIAFINESNIQLPHEIEYYNQEEGHLIAWVNVTRLHKNRDTYLFLYYGNPDAENQQNIENVWSNGYIMVQHLNETTGDTLRDSTSNNNDGTRQGNAMLNQTGRIDGAYSFNGYTDYINIPTSTTLNITGSITIEAWVKDSESQGPNSPGTVTSTKNTGDVEWINPENAKTSDNQYAEAHLPGSATLTEYLNATDFSFKIPTWSIVKGIKVEVEKKANTGNCVVDQTVRLLKNGVPYGDNKATGVYWPTRETYVTYGGENDLWGGSWTPEDINSNRFGFILQAMDEACPSRIYVDHIRITITYTSPIMRDIVNKTKNTYAIVLDSAGTTLTGYINNTPVATSIDKNWHHVALVYNQTRITLYKDGVKVNETSKTGVIPTSSQPLIIGRGVIGTIDEVRVSNTARTSTWINTTYLNMHNPGGYIQIESEQNQTYTYLKVTIKNTGSRTLNIRRCHVLVDGEKKLFIHLQPYNHPLTESIILVNIIKKAESKVKFIVDTGEGCYRGYQS
jgi:archaellum component FlaF (FlaF/FlaG flagellin family)